MLLFSSALTLPSNGFAQANSLPGSWRSDQFGHVVILQLEKDGSGTFEGASLRYATKGNSLLITIAEVTVDYTFNLTGNRLVLAGGDLDGQVVFLRTDEDTHSVFSATSQELIGLWSGGGEMIEFKADGSCVYRGSKFPYRVSQGHLIIETTNGNVIFEYAIEQKNLILTVNGQRSIYARPITVSGPTKKDGKVPLELVGQWCYMNTTNNAQSSRCITFRGDGTYTYSAEGSRNVNSPDVSGGTSSQDSDSGTWYLYGDRIYYQGRIAGSGSFLLEKRNHPKNIKDPMIVLDGEPFVSTTQRPPWR
jgi:hypothetical protein